MDRQDVAAVLGKKISLELLGSAIPARLAYTGVDGAPRVIPIAFLWDGTNVVMATVPKAAKVKALQKDPKVAITIDTQSRWPPQVLLIRGLARLELVDGVPDAYVEASRKVTPADQFDAWTQGVHALYDQMVLITVEPEWAKLLDFETTIPQAVQDIVMAKQAEAAGQG